MNMWIYIEDNRNTTYSEEYIVSSLHTGQDKKIRAPTQALSKAIGRTLHFSANDDATGVELWRMAMEHTVLYG